MKWLIQSIKLQLSVISANVYAPNEVPDSTIINLLIIGNILFVLIHPEAASLGILGVLLAWKFYRTKKTMKF